MFLIPEFLVYGAMVYLSFMGIWCSRKRIYLDPIHFLAFLPQAFLYLYFDLEDTTIFMRAPFVRLSLFLLPMYLALTLTFQYWRLRARYG